MSRRIFLDPDNPFGPPLASFDDGSISTDCEEWAYNTLQTEPIIDEPGKIDGEDLKTFYDRKMNEHFLLSFNIKPGITGWPANTIAPKIDPKLIVNAQEVGKRFTKAFKEAYEGFKSQYSYTDEEVFMIYTKWAVEKIIFNPPATIVFWKDGSKTVVKCQSGQSYNPYFGFTAALAKKLYGSSSAVNRMVNSYPVAYPVEVKKECEPDTNEAGNTSSRSCGKCKHRSKAGYEEPCKNCISCSFTATESFWVEAKEPEKSEEYPREVSSVNDDYKMDRACNNCKYRNNNHDCEPCDGCVHAHISYKKSYWMKRRESK